MEEKKKLKITANKKVITFSLIALALIMLVSTSYAYFTAVITGNDTAKQTKVTTGIMALKLHGNTEVGMSSAMPGDSTTITFSVENTGTLATTYALTMDQVTNNFVDKNDLVYTITSTNNGGTKTETIIPSSNGILIPLISIEPNVIQEYTMTITFRETNDIQNDNQGKTFTGRVQIDTLENSNYLAAKVINTNTMTDYESLSNWKYNQTVSINTPNVGGGICVTDSFDNFNLANREFSNYTCDVTNPEDYIGWYTFGYNDYISGSEIYKINAAKGTVITNVDIFNVELRPYDGVIKMQDENGTSYVNRGSITNNYVSFANKTWRIVRVNGDGTVRLILDGDTGTNKEFSTANNGHKYVGYTYDNDHVCTKANPCTSETGTNSVIKNYLENEWYTANLAAYEDRIAISSYCNDTTSKINGTQKYYKANDRIIGGAPSLECEDTTETYGGYYKLKIGLLSADEAMLAGIPYSPSDIYKSYLSQNSPFWSFSPSASGTSSTTTYTFIIYSGDIGDRDSISANAIRPVINLKADTLITSGNGTKDSPYVIATN